MKTKSLPLTALALFVFCTVLSFANAQLPFRPLHEAPPNAQEEQQLNSIFSQARAASADVTGADAGFQRRQIAIELNNELENFAASHTNSAWTPGVHLWLAGQAQLRSAYSLAMEHYGEVWAAARGVANPTARQIAGEAMGGLERGHGKGSESGQESGHPLRRMVNGKNCPFPFFSSSGLPSALNSGFEEN